jgi:hypothetical protein
VIAAFCDSALRCAALGRCAFVEHSSLPDAVFDSLLGFFGISASEDEARRMREIARADAKNPRVAFAAPNGERDPTGELDRLAAELLDPAYAALRAATNR